MLIYFAKHYIQVFLYMWKCIIVESIENHRDLSVRFHEFCAIRRAQVHIRQPPRKVGGEKHSGGALYRIYMIFNLQPSGSLTDTLYGAT